MIVHALINPSTQETEAEAGGLEVQDQPQLHKEFKAILATPKPISKKIKKVGVLGQQTKVLAEQARVKHWMPQWKEKALPSTFPLTSR